MANAFFSNELLGECQPPHEPAPFFSDEAQGCTIFIYHLMIYTSNGKKAGKGKSAF